MKESRFIAGSNMPPNLGLSQMLLAYLALDHFGAPGWAYGVTFTVLGVVVVSGFIKLWTGTAVDLLDGKR